MLHQIKAHQFYNDLGLYQLCQVPLKIVEFKDTSRLLSNFPVLFKADLIFKDISRNPSKFKYFSSLCEPWRHNSIKNIPPYKGFSRYTRECRSAEIDSQRLKYKMRDRHNSIKNIPLYKGFSRSTRECRSAEINSQKLKLDLYLMMLDPSVKSE